jgi:hypothetical protein
MLARPRVVCPAAIQLPRTLLMQRVAQKHTRGYPKFAELTTSIQTSLELQTVKFDDQQQRRELVLPTCPLCFPKVTGVVPRISEDTCIGAGAFDTHFEAG